MRRTSPRPLFVAAVMALLVTCGLLSVTPGASADLAAASTTTSASTATSYAAQRINQLGSKASGRYRPKVGPVFNNPYGSTASKDRGMAHVRKAVNNAPKHSIIRIALYSFNRADLATALIKACERKVTVQMVLNDNTITRQMLRVQRVLGTNQKPHVSDACHPREARKNPANNSPYPEPSFFKICAGACRINAPKGNQHIKMYLFSKTGRAENVVMFGSNNLTTYAAHTHWNDLYTLREKPQMFLDFSTIFRQLAKDRPLAEPYATFAEPPFFSEFGAKASSWGPADPVIQRLDRIGCRPDPATGVGRKGRTVIKVTMYAWAWSRGVKVAQKMAELKRRGCIVTALLSAPGARVVGVLRRAGIEMRTADRNLDHNLETGFDETPFEKFTHEKWMTVDGTFDGQPAQILWTGSENWSTLSLHNDELTVSIPYAAAVKAYSDHFNYVWNHHSVKMRSRYLRIIADSNLLKRSTLE